MTSLGKLFASATFAATMVVATPSQAVVLSSAGDADCFGLGGSCPPGTLWQDQLGGVFFTDNSTPADPAFTDEWSAFIGPTYGLTYAGGANTAIEILIAGVADNRGPWDVLFNGTVVGSLTTNTATNNFQEVRLFTFAIAPGLLLANNVVTLGTTGAGGDGFSVDYISLLGDAGAVPEPSTWAMMLLGFGLLGGALRRRRLVPLPTLA